jgi:hypothetical protein
VPSPTAECRGGGASDLLARNVTHVLGQVPPVAEGIGELPLQVAPELIREWMETSAPASTACRQSVATSSVNRWRTTGVPPMLCGDRTPASGNSSATLTAESPNHSST